MTGNVVFLGFGIAGAGGISIWASLTALGSFLVGGVCGGRMRARRSVRPAFLIFGLEPGSERQGHAHRSSLEASQLSRSAGSG